MEPYKRNWKVFELSPSSFEIKDQYGETVCYIEGGLPEIDRKNANMIVYAVNGLVEGKWPAHAASL